MVTRNPVTAPCVEKLMVHPLKNILNGLRWDSRENPDDYLITYRHRGAPEDVKIMRGSQIQKIGKSYFTITDTANEDEVVIPFHRILEIRNTALGRVVWTKRSNPSRESKA